MGLRTPDFPPVDPATFMDEPLMSRMRTLSRHWVEYGFGTQKTVHLRYVAKLVGLYILAGPILATWSSGTAPFWDVAGWWAEPIVYQKMVLWTVLIETVGFGGSWGTLSCKFKPQLGAILFWARTGTIRLRPWRWMPGTNGDRRTLFDVVLYLGFLVSVAVAFCMPGVVTGGFAAALPRDAAGVVQPVPVIVAIVLLVLVGVRDKVVFLSARGEQYLPAMVFFAFYPFIDMIVALKLLIVVVWLGAGVSKIGKHFANVVPPMLSNSPCVPTRWFRRKLYRSFPDDLRPSKLARFIAHGGGTCVELVAPWVLLFSADKWLTLAAVLLMALFHLVITSTFPLAVPLEWNILFAYAPFVLFLGFPASQGYGVADMNLPLLIVTVAALAFFPVLGNLRPDLVSFLPSMRQYAGNWSVSLWAFAPGAEEKLNAVTRPCGNQIDQLNSLGYPPPVSEVVLQQVIAWRSMHSQARGLFSLALRHVPNPSTWSVREGELVAGCLVGFNFGDGHLENEDLTNALRARCDFEPGEAYVFWVESQPIHKKTQAYKVVDIAVGVVERGTWNVADAVAAQPWLPDGPIPMRVTWSLGGSPRLVK